MDRQARLFFLDLLKPIPKIVFGAILFWLGFVSLIFGILTLFGVEITMVGQVNQLLAIPAILFSGPAVLTGAIIMS